jgi:hypothetical protein
MVVTSNTSPPVVGSTALLAAGCTNAPTSYNWSNCTSSGTLCQAQSGAAGVQNYSVSGSNAGGTGPAAARNVDWQSGTPAPPGLCGQFASYLFSDLGWVGIQIYSRDYTDGAGFAWNGVWVVRISVPPNASGTHPGRVNVAEFGGPPTFRELTISRTACDFRPTDPTGNNGPILRDQSPGPNDFFGLGASSGGSVGLAPGVDYYVNVRNWNPASNSISCDAAALRCEAFFYLQLPQ